MERNQGVVFFNPLSSINGTDTISVQEPWFGFMKKIRQNIILHSAVGLPLNSSECFKAL